MSKYHLTVQHDPDTTCPCEDGDGRWQIYSFSTRHNRYKNPEELLDEETGNLSEEIKAKLKAGLAFFLSYYEHGLCRWSLAGTGPQCQWDTVQRAGIAIWEEDESNLGPTEYVEREKDCKIALDEYTDWCNGNCYYYKITTKQGEEIDSCGGIIGDYIERAIHDSLPEDATKENTEIEDELGILSYRDVFSETA
jgi:hypothetical protein